MNIVTGLLEYLDLVCNFLKGGGGICPKCPILDPPLYSSLQYDLQLSGLTVNLVSIEIGCLGHFLSETIAQMATAREVPKKTVRSLFEQAARIAVSCMFLQNF